MEFVEAPCAATPAFFTLAGIIDDVRTLHESIMGTLNVRCEAHWDEKNRAFNSSLFAIVYECKAPLKKLLNAFYGKHAKLFFDSEKQLFVADKTLLKIPFIGFDYDENRPLNFTFRRMEIDSFCATLERVAAELLYYKAQREKKTVTAEKVFEALDERFKRLESIWKEQGDKAASPPPRECPKLYLYKNLLQVSCYKNHNVVASSCDLEPADLSGQTAHLPVHRCLTCGRIFIGWESLKIFTKLHGLLLFERLLDESMAGDRDYEAFNLESKLHRMGYNVRADGGLSERERRDLLVSLLENKYMSFLEICGDIENAIRLFEGRATFEDALWKWHEDLRFINKYVLTHKV